MRVLIINPNSDPEMTAAIQRAAVEYAAGEFEVECKATPGAPRFIETYEDESWIGRPMVELLRENYAEYDAFVLACHCDPNLDTLKEISEKPVVGIGEASIKIASMLGHRFSVISPARHSIPNKEALIRKYHLQGMLASVRAPEDGTAAISDEEKYLEAARLALQEDMAEVIVLGCAGMAGLDKRLQERLGAPVLDGVICALIIATGLAKYGVGTSKVRRYKAD